MRVPGWLVPLLEMMRDDHAVLDGDIAWIAGWCYTESGFDRWAIRYEPAFFNRYVTPLGLRDPTEAKARAMSWGLFQVMGQVAREQGFDGRYLSQTVEPWTNCDLAARYLKQLYQRADRTWAGALASYNGGLGGNRRPPYRNAGYVEKVARNREMFEGVAG